MNSTKYLASWVCPVTAPPIKAGAVVVAADRITYVGLAAEAPRASNEVQLGHAILIPGLVNTHCHLELTAMRGFLDGLGFREWILRLTAARRAVLTPEMLLDSARLGITEGLVHGVTTYADTGDTGAGFDAMLEAGVRGICYREVFGPAPSAAVEALNGLMTRVAEMRSRATAMVRVGVSPHAPYTVSDELFRLTSDFARQENLPLAVHVAESEIESLLVEQGTGEFADGLRARGFSIAPRGASPIQLLASLGVLDANALLIHCVRVGVGDMESIARHDCAVAHCPASNAKLGHGIAPLTAFLRAGIRTGIGTDSVASNDRMDVLDEARLAILMASAREQRHDVLGAASALELATLGGARALGIDRDAGSLEVGKVADMTAFPLPAHRSPIHDPVAALVFSIAGTPASFVCVAGNTLVADGRLLQQDAAVPARLQRGADKLQEWLATEKSLVGA